MADSPLIVLVVHDQNPQKATGTVFFNLGVLVSVFDWDTLAEKARDDIKVCLDSWVSVLVETLGDHVKCAYAKGSAVKPWESPIDYVPTISDVDIHIKLDGEADLFPYSEDPFQDSMCLSKHYEDRFTELKPDHLHIPRSQLSLVDKLIEDLEYVPPRKRDVRVLIGRLSEPVFPSTDRIRSIDLENLLSLSEFVAKIPSRVADRSGLDFWAIIREMTWRVSPGPVRLLTQTADDPLDVWSWNRTHIAQELCAQGYNEIARRYQDFYMAGWNLFLSGFTSSDDFRWATTSGYYVLHQCLREAESMH
ncbi:MAG: hypothetical protein C4K48_08815 [Candidatus Thorarchaeota archaeon]|nr:MAG: hypothetical protein C4K48_08815 [Candidatus Thorarchaeota archaeon]